MSVSLQAWRPPALRTDDEFEQPRAVSGLEVYFDLAFVVVISRLAYRLGGHLDLAGVGTFVVQFVTVCWVWNCFSYYTERFTADRLEIRLLTFLAIIPVAGLGFYGEGGFGTAYAWFASAYLLARAVSQLAWARVAYYVPVFRPAAARLVTGFAIVAAIMLASFEMTGAARVALFTLAVALDIATPYFTIAGQPGLPKLSPSRFPERFALFTIIVLGESVVGVSLGLYELESWGVLTIPGLVAGALGLTVVFALWWVYFDFVARRPPKPVATAAVFWVYLHVAALTAITATGVGVTLAVANGATGLLTAPSRYLLSGAVVAGLLAVAALETTLATEPGEPTYSRLSPAVKLVVAAVIGGLGVADLGWGTPDLLAMLIAGLTVPIVYGGVVWLTQRVDVPAQRAPSR